MEKIMRKTNDTSNVATFEHHGRLADSELDAVNGGTKCTGGAGGPVTLRDLAKILGELEQAKAGNVR